VAKQFSVLFVCDHFMRKWGNSLPNGTSYRRGRRYVEELRTVAERRVTYEGLLATLDIAKAYDDMVYQMAVAERVMADDYRLFPQGYRKPKIK
jgi:hypothetical protein